MICTAGMTKRGSGWPAPNGAEPGKHRRGQRRGAGKRQNAIAGCSAPQSLGGSGVDGEVGVGSRATRRAGALGGEAGGHRVAAALDQQSRPPPRHRPRRRDRLPATDRPDADGALAVPSPTTTAGRRKRSTSRLATMPTTPGMPAVPGRPQQRCGSSASPLTRRDRAPPSTACSISCRSRLSASSRAASGAASAGSSLASSRAPRSACPTRPPALMRGPMAKPRSRAEAGRATPADVGDRAQAGVAAAAMIFSPCVTNARLTPASGTMSQTVPSATRSSHCRRSGSGRAGIPAGVAATAG